MPNYDLFGLDPRTFQQLCQALALAELGAGVIVFGDGRDGARDAAFRGKVNYPSEVDQWDGSLIIQAKFRQVRIEDTQKAGDWVLRQLKFDLSKFKGAPTQPDAPPPKKQPPDYYLLVTNISLTPVPETGSDARVRNLLGEYAGHLGLKGYDIWDGEKIQRLLDKHREIAISYGGYITVGDVLRRMHEYLDGIQPDFTTVMADFLLSEFTGPDQYARLNEAGSTVQRRSLAHVFVDLPVVDQVSGRPPDDQHTGDGRLPTGFLAEILSVAGLRFDRSSVLERQERDILADSDDQAADMGRIVLIGGPGQGKSTLGQFICQLFRAALLRDRDKAELTEDSVFVLNLIDQWCEKGGFALPKVRRFPVRVELKAFADDLASGKSSSLLEYIAQRIDKRSGGRVDRNDLARWLGTYPWVLVLDGLDEVPSAGNRGDVLEEIQQLNSQCATRGADVLIVATSRPQGYSDAFSPRFYWHRYLAPLSIPRALYYAKRLVEVCHVDDKDKQEEVLNRLQKASNHPNTQRLMLSPLQVTILAVLAELQGELPDDRWELFQEYYQTIYKRETQRNQSLSPILRDYKVEIDQAHERVGIRLQILNEATGGNDAFLNRAQLASILRECLGDRFDQGDQQLDRVANQIETAALERLVFLVSPEGEDVGFEIRSFQEFMAARALTDGTDEQICNRLKAIAACPFWRNVFLFAAGRCVRDRRHLIEFIIGICTTLNNDIENPACIHTMAGSSLAMDLLEDATFHRTRKHSLSLTDTALRLLASPSDTLLQRLATVCQRSESPSFILNAVRTFIESKDVDEHSGGWCVLLHLIELGVHWAENLAEELWPKSIAEQIKCLKTVSLWEDVHSGWIVRKRIGLSTHLHPHYVSAGLSEQDSPPWLTSFERILERSRVNDRILLRIDDTRDPSIVLHFTRIPEFDDDWRDILQMPDPTGSWTEIVATARFVEKPSKETLAAELANLAKEDPLEVDENRRWANYFAPWPLALCLRAANSGRSLRELSEAANEGEFGDFSEWIAVQDSWMTHGVTLNDLEQVVQLDSANLPIEATWIYFCHTLSYADETRGDFVADLQRVIDLYESVPGVKQREKVGAMIAAGLSKMRGFKHGALNVCPKPKSFKSWFGGPGARPIPANLDEIMPWPQPLTEEWLETLDFVGRNTHSPARPIRFRRIEEESNSDFFSELVSGYTNAPSRKGVLRLITRLLPAKECDQRIPKELLWPTGDELPEVRADALSLLLLWGNLSIAEARILSRVAEELCDMGQSRCPNFPRLSILFRHWDQLWAMEFIVNLVQNLPARNKRTRAECLEWFDYHLSRRLSPLHEVESARKLGLSRLT